MCRDKRINIEKECSLFRYDIQTYKGALVLKKYQQKSSRCKYLKQNINELKNQKETFPSSYGSVYFPLRHKCVDKRVQKKYL